MRQGLVSNTATSHRVVPVINPVGNKREIHVREVANTLADAPRGRFTELDITAGECRVRAINTAARARATKPQTQDEAVKNQMEAGLADRDAANHLKLPEGVINASGEMLSPEYKKNSFKDYLLDTLENPSMLSVIASEYRVDLAAYIDSRVAELAIDAAQSAQANNSLEKMLCHQMAAAHRAAMKMLGQAVRVPNYPVEVARLSNAAARMMQVYQEGLLALQKIRTGGKQTVVVQHVQVADGGQAVVAATVKSGEVLK